MRQLSTWIIILSILVGTTSLTFILQLEVCTFAVAQAMVLFNTDIIRETIEVSTIVADDQFAETIDKGKVTIAVQTTYVFRTDGDEVTMIDVAQSCCGVAKDSVGVYENLVTTHRYIATCKDCIVDVDTRKIKFAPVRCICCLVTQCIQIVNGDIFSLCKVACAAALLVIPETISINSLNDVTIRIIIEFREVDAIRICYFTIWRNIYPTVISHTVSNGTTLVVVAATIFRQTITGRKVFGIRTNFLSVCTIDISYITTAKDVAIA